MSASSPPETSAPRPRNKYSCNNCRNIHRPCVYRNPSDHCELCVRRNLTDCGQKVDSNGRPRPGAVSAVPAVPAVPPVSPVTPRLTAHSPGHTRGSTITNTQDLSDDTHPGPSASNRRGLSTTSGFSKIELLTGLVAFKIHIVSTWLLFLRLEAAPHLHEQLNRDEVFFHAIISWLNSTFATLVAGFSDSDRQLIQPLHTIQAICEVALRRGPFPNPTHNTRPRARATSINMSVLWNEFCERCPRPRSILACVIKILSDLDAGSVRYGLSISEWSYEESYRLYDRTSKIFNLIYQAYSPPIDGTESPTNLFPLWQIAYRNRHKDFALRVWSQIRHVQQDVDLFGLGQAHWAVVAGDITTLCEMTAQDPYVGHSPKSGRLYLSPKELAAITNSRSSYLNLTNVTNWEHRDLPSDWACLILAAKAGALGVVELLTTPTFTFPPYSTVVRQAIEARQDRVAWFFLVRFMNHIWSPEDCSELADLAAQNGFDELAWGFRTMIQSEPEASHAHADVCDQSSQIRAI